MKKQQLLFLIFLLGSISFQSTANDCSPAQGKGYLHGNQVRTPFLTGGDMFWNLSDGEFYVPYNSNAPTTTASTMFAAAFWIGGLDAADNLKMAAQTYRQGGNDFWPGPLDENGETASTSCNNFDRVWKAPGYAVAAHLADFSDGTIDDPIDVHLLQWPGRNNIHFFAQFGFDLPDQELAPFFDSNNDGIYNPEDGDYPVIDATMPDVIANDLLWTVFNDKGNIHSETGGEQMGLEIQLTSWAFSCTNDSTLDRTVFSRYKIINKSDMIFFDTYAGIWADLDVGCWDNDYIGSAPDLNTYYAYNGEATDPDCSDFGGGIIYGYGDNPPAQAVTLLNQDLSSFVLYNNDGTVQGNPSTALDHYNYLRGIWRDGNAVEYGGDGYNEGTFATPFMYPSQPSSIAPDAWSEPVVNNVPGDRRGIGAIGPLLFEAGAIKEIDVAYSFHWDTDKSNLENVDYMYENIPKLQASYAADFADIDCQIWTNPMTPTRDILEASLTIAPNPATDYLLVSLEGGLVEIAQLYDANGRLVYEQKPDSKTFNIEVQDLPSGIYYLKIGSEDLFTQEKICVMK